MYFSWALAWVNCNHVIKCAAWSLEQCIYTLSSAGTGIPSRVCLYHPPYGGSSLVFCCPGAWEFHQTLESNLSTALILLYCDISLSGQSDKSHMASPHERTTAASSRCCAVDGPWSGKLVSRTVSELLLKSSLRKRDVVLWSKTLEFISLWRMKIQSVMFFISKAF